MTGYTDMRKSIDGLMAIVRDTCELDPYSNSLFLFCGRRCDRIKALHFEKDGFCLYYKRLDNGRFQWPRDPSEVTAKMQDWIKKLKLECFTSIIVERGLIKIAVILLSAYCEKLAIACIENFIISILRRL